MVIARRNVKPKGVAETKLKEYGHKKLRKCFLDEVTTVDSYSLSPTSSYQCN